MYAAIIFTAAPIIVALLSVWNAYHSVLYRSKISDSICHFCCIWYTTCAANIQGIIDWDSCMYLAALLRLVNKTIVTHLVTTLSMQIQDTCFLQRLQLFLVEMWSDCSGSRHHQGPLTLESTIVNSTVTLVIPHLFPKCHVTARVQNQEVFNSSSNITFG